jgi:hypothetical protein
MSKAATPKKYVYLFEEVDAIKNSFDGDWEAETGFLVDYLQSGLIKDNPFASIDADGVGRLMEIAIKQGRATRKNLEIGVCGEHGGDPRVPTCVINRVSIMYRVRRSEYRLPGWQRPMRHWV